MQRGGTPKFLANARAQAQELAIAGVSERGVVLDAVEKAGVSRQQLNAWRREDAAFAAAFEDAKETATDRLEQRAFELAYEGVEEPVYSQGKVVGTVRKWDSSTLQFMLKGRRREVYGTKAEISGPNGGPVEISKPEVTQVFVTNILTGLHQTLGGDIRVLEGEPLDPALPNGEAGTVLNLPEP